MGRSRSKSNDIDIERGPRHENRTSSRDRSPTRRNTKIREPSSSPPRRRPGERSWSPPRRRRPSPDYEHSHRHRSPSRSPPPKRRRHEDSRSTDHDRRRRRHTRSRSPRQHHHHHHHHPRNRRSYSRSPPPPAPPAKRSHKPLPSQNDAFTSSDAIARKSSPPPEKQKANYAPSGLLAAETNTVANTDIILKYNEPAEARAPPATQQWRLYVFKGDDVLDTLQLWERSCWLFGREGRVVDYAVEHPSCSKQHAVLQFRYLETQGEWGERKGRTRLYVLDLESANGTSLNGDKVPERRFVEVKSGDVIKFGDSSREYVALLPPKEDGGKGKDGA